MTAKSILMWTILCNECKVDVCGGSDYAAWADIETPMDIAQDADWIVRGEDFAICGTCWIARACRIFGHQVNETKAGARCTRCLDAVDLPEDLVSGGAA